jgi:hypothetical protein
LGISSSSADGDAAVEALAADRAAHVEVVSGLGAAHDADLGRVGPGAAVGAAGHVESHREVAQAGGVEGLAEVGDDAGHDPLGLGEGLAARREGGAGHGVAVEGPERVDRAAPWAAKAASTAARSSAAKPVRSTSRAAGEAELRPPPLDHRSAARWAPPRPDGTGTPSTQPPSAAGHQPRWSALSSQSNAPGSARACPAPFDLGSEPVDAALVDTA